MPHLTLEYSSNIQDKNNLVNLLKECNQLLAENLPTALGNCKSRAVERSIYCVGEGSPNNAFLHVQLKIMPGRTEEKLKAVSEAMMKLLKQHLSKSCENLNIELTIEIEELQKTYYKSK